MNKHPKPERNSPLPSEHQVPVWPRREGSWFQTGPSHEEVKGSCLWTRKEPRVLLTDNMSIVSAR